MTGRLACICFISSARDSDENDLGSHFKCWQGFALDVETGTCHAGMLGRPAANPPQLHGCCIHTSGMNANDSVFWDVQYHIYESNSTIHITNVQQVSYGDAIQLSTDWSAIVPETRHSCNYNHSCPPLQSIPSNSETIQDISPESANEFHFSTDLVLVGQDAFRYMDKYFPKISKQQDSLVCMGKLTVTC